MVGSKAGCQLGVEWWEVMLDDSQLGVSGGR